MDFVRDYMRALLAKEIDAVAELQEQRSRVVYQQYCAGGTIHRGYYCPSLTKISGSATQNVAAFARSGRRRKDYHTYTALMRQIALLLLSICTAQRSISCTIQE